MKPLLVLLLTTVITTSGLLVHPTATPETIPTLPAPASVRTSGSRPTGKKMKPFRSERELARYFSALVEKRRRQEARRAAKARREARRKARRAAKPWGNMVIVAAIAGEVLNATESAVSVSVTESVTNLQHAGVDEGGIVKVHGNHLVILRRGRLFTVAINDRELKPISAVDAFGPGIDPKHAWYDEMLISDNTVIVIGYSYTRGGTEVGLFEISDDGALSYKSTYQLRSADYYSSRNYASRLIGRKLIFYSPQHLSAHNTDPIKSFPAVRKWHEGASDEEFRRTVRATRVYRPETQFNQDHGVTLHTVTVCDLANGGFDCQGTSVLGPSGRVFYVSPDAVYIWASKGGPNLQNNSLLFRMPLDGSAPGALRVSGGPVDQFSFLQSDDGHLNVLVRSEADGDGMWAAEVTDGDVALLRVPITSFSDGSEFVPPHTYRQLARPDDYTFQNRFVGNYLIYGAVKNSGSPAEWGRSKLFIVDWRDGHSNLLVLPHSVDRIERLGSDAVVVGTHGKDLYFSSVRLSRWPQIASHYKREGASQGELRSHGFFYKPDDDDSGTLGLPIRVAGRPGYEHLFRDSAAILFLRNDSLQFHETGELVSQPEKAIDDQCRASCVDWYGNARPLFLRGRVFALLGYELVEGTIANGRITELQRINYSPGPNESKNSH